VIHEASHLSNRSVGDQVYYDEPGFFEADEAKKVGNAAHYEELPRRVMGTSKFDGQTFTPGTRPGGGAVTREDNVKAAVNLYVRKAWDAGVDAHSFIREVRLRYQRGETKPFTDNQALIFEMSNVMDLTVHEQALGKAVVTTLDVTLSESISRGVALVKAISGGIPYPPTAALPDAVRAAALEARSDVELRDMMVAAAVTKYGRLLQDPARDKALLDWLEAHYQSLPSI